MKRGVNKATIMGKVVGEVKIKKIEDQIKLVSFTVMTIDYFTEKVSGKKIYPKEFHKIVVFPPLTFFAEQNVKEGCFMYLTGEVKTSKWQKEDGSYRYSTQIVAKELHKVGQLQGFEVE